MTYREAISEGRRLYKEAMDKAANYALYISEKFDRPLQVVCKEIAEDGWNALRRRAQRLQETAGQTPDERARDQERETTRLRLARAKQALKNPDEAATVLADPVVAAAVEHALYEQAHRHGRPDDGERGPMDWRDLLMDLRYMRRRASGVLQKLSGGLRVPAAERADFAEAVNELRAALDLIESGIVSGRSIADEVREFLEEEATA